MLRCCRDSFNWHLKDRTPVEGERLDCRWGGETWLYQNGQWVEQPPWDEKAVANREQRYQEILGK